MSKLYIFGDSYSIVSIKDSAQCWYNLLATKLGVSETINFSVSGGCQDWAWHQMHQQYDQITPDDYIVVILTHPGRFWFSEEHPSITKLRGTDTPPGIDDNLWIAVRSFIRYIQRPSLDTVWLENRLAWLSYNAYLRKWRTPQVIMAFDQKFDIAKSYPDISIANGSLFDNVSIKEFQPDCRDRFVEILGMNDLRYNHMCLPNHAIFANKIYNAIQQQHQIDLTVDFIENLLNRVTVKDKEFMEKNFDPTVILDKEESFSYFGRFKK